MKKSLYFMAACMLGMSITACSTAKLNEAASLGSAASVEASVEMSAETGDQTETESETGESGGVTGEFTGTGKGFGGDVTVTIELENSELKNVIIGGDKETPNVGGEAMKKLASEMLENTTVNVDAVTGATFTSSGVFEAIDAALATAGLTTTDFAMVEKTAGGETVKQTTDLLIIGAGGAGLTCGNAALENGIGNVMILEKMAFVGGATANAGGIDAGMSKLQEELGMSGDSCQLIHDDIMASGENHNEDLVWIMANNQGATLDWLKEKYGVPFNDRYASDFPEHTIQRFFVCDGGMQNAMSILQESFVVNGGDLKLETRATELMVDDDGKVIGAKATDADGNVLEVNADAVVIATGGYGANQEMISQKKGDLQYAVFYGVQSSTGDGQQMGEAVGAKMLNMGYAKLYPNGISQPGTNEGKATPMPTLTTVNSTGAIFVNKEGRRFVNENLAFADIKNATCEQPDEIMYLVMDQTGYDMWSEAVDASASVTGRISLEQQQEYFNADSDQPTFTRGSLQEAAAKAGIDAAALEKTVEEWNTGVENGTDPFDRQNLFKLDTSGEVYIVEQKLRFATTLGGFDITENFECQKEDGTIIPGLYAIGEVVGGPNGTEAIPGSMAAWAVTSGRMCGEYLSKAINK